MRGVVLNNEPVTVVLLLKPLSICKGYHWLLDS